MSDALDHALSTLVTSLQQAFAEDLVAVVLFGSAAEQRQRAVSDTNVAVVVRKLDPECAEAARGVIGLAQVALRLRLLLLRSDEITEAASAFAVKFSDIQRRRRVLYGTDPFKDLAVPRSAAIAQLHQALLNLAFRLREQWLTARDDRQLALSVAHLAGGLRACAAELLTLEGSAVTSPREALERVAGGPIPALTAARSETLPLGEARGLHRRMVDLTEQMRTRASGLT
jgi:hypothetical protein